MNRPAIFILLPLLTIAGCRQPGFVHVVEGHFERAGRPHAFVGANLWYAMHLGMAAAPGDRERFARELDHLRDLGVTNLRIMAAAEGPADAPYRVTPPLLTAPGEYDQRVLDGLDWAVAEIARRDMQAVLVLTNFWEWSGGMAACVAWDSGDPIPYPRDGRYEQFLDYAARFYTSERCQQWYRDHIAMLLARRNPYTGRRYRDEPAIFAWQLANEPRHYPPAWITDTADFIRAQGARQMISTGSEGRVGGDFRATHEQGIDYATVHIWPQNWAWYDPDNPATYASAERLALDYLHEHIDGARQLGLPLVLEEFGLSRDAPDNAGRYDPQAPTTTRDRFFAALYAEVLASLDEDGPLRGSNFWTWTGQGRPGDALLGDPPHEPPGWYSVYDDDHRTLEVIRRHAASVRERVKK